MGRRQSGLMQFRIADLARDADLLGEVSERAGVLMRENRDLAAQLVDRWIGKAGRYSQV